MSHQTYFLCFINQVAVRNSVFRLVQNAVEIRGLPAVVFVFVANVSRERFDNEMGAEQKLVSRQNMIESQGVPEVYRIDG